MGLAHGLGSYRLMGRGHKRIRPSVMSHELSLALPSNAQFAIFKLYCRGGSLRRSQYRPSSATAWTNFSKSTGLTT